MPLRFICSCIFTTTLQASPKYKKHKNIKCQKELWTIKKVALNWFIPTRPTLAGVVGTKKPINLIKNGKLIYESDIVKDLIIPEISYIVEWFNGGFHLVSTISGSFLKFNDTQQEVIGNIYDNPELLEEVKNEYNNNFMD